MVRVIFDGSKLSLDKFYQQGTGGISYFEGIPYQRGFGQISNYKGAGVGSVVRQIWRFLKPLASTISPIAASLGSAIGKEGLDTTARVLTKVVQGGDIKEALSGESKEGVKRLLEKATTKLQEGRGRKRKSSRPKTRIILKPSDIVGKTVPQKAILKKKRLDSLGYY
jgi:hypothetical protein